MDKDTETALREENEQLTLALMELAERAVTAIEAMRAKCEAITRDPANTAATISARGAAYDIADKIAALKGNGEGR